jgi:hypothetical protein
MKWLYKVSSNPIIQPKPCLQSLIHVATFYLSIKISRFWERKQAVQVHHFPNFITTECFQFASSHLCTMSVNYRHSFQMEFHLCRFLQCLRCAGWSAYITMYPPKTHHQQNPSIFLYSFSPICKFCSTSYSYH